MSTTKFKHKAYSRPNDGPKKVHARYTGADGYSHNNGDFAFSSDFKVWSQGKTRRTKNFPDLF